MPEITSTDLAALTAEMRNLITTIRSSGSMGAGSDLYKSFDDINKAAKLTAKQYGASVLDQKRQAEQYAKSMQHLISSNEMGSKELEDAASVYKRTLSNSSSEWVKQIGATINSTEDFIAAQRIASQEFIEDFKEAKKLNLAGEHLKVKRILEKYGDQTIDLSKTVEQVTQEHKEFVAASEQARHNYEGGMAKSLKDLAGKYSKIGAAVVAVTGLLVKLAKSAAQTGTQIELFDAALMGMSSEELNQLQAENKRAILASGQSLDQFNEAVSKNSMGLITYTGSLRDAVRINAQSYEIGRILGINQEKYMNEQADRFKKLNRGLSMTAEQFMEMNQRLMDSKDVQSQLYRINVSQRAAYMEDLQNTYRKLQLDGLTHEQALKMLEVFSEIGAKSPRERLKEAAKLQAVMGAMGMGAQGAEAGKLLRGGMRGAGEQERFAQIMKEANVVVGEKMGQGFASEMMTMEMINAAGLERYLGSGSDFADLNIRQEAAIKENVLATQEQTPLIAYGNSILEKIMAGWDVMTSILRGDIWEILSKILAAVVGIGVFSKIGKSLAGRGLMQGIGNTAKDIGSRALGMAKNIIPVGAGLLRGTGVAGAGMLGWEAGTLINKGLEKFAPDFYRDMSDVIGGTIDSVVTGISNVFKNNTEFAGEQKLQQQANNKDDTEQKKQIDQENTFRQELLKSAAEQVRLNRELVQQSQKTVKAVETQTEEEKKRAEEAKSLAERGYRITWLRRAQT